MTFWKQISQANLPLPLFLLIILFSRSLPSRRTPLSQRLKQVTFYFTGSLSSVEASLYRREGWRDGKRKREGDDGKGKGEKASFPARFLFFDYCYFYWDTQREPLLRRESLDWMLRGGDWELVKQCKHTNKFPNKLSDKSSSQTLSRKIGSCPCRKQKYHTYSIYIGRSRLRVLILVIISLLPHLHLVDWPIFRRYAVRHLQSNTRKFVYCILSMT